ncbi:MAG: class I SAM-dependent methyltransferase, partial [Deltaproteobacteria bacterium]|nr:class I SAM-dependent methyltransferase [Deltaproteobacteria bacterium]
VEGVDISPEAVDNALALAGRNRVHVKAMVADLEEHYQIEKEAYDLIVCFNYLQRSLIPRIKEGLRPGGMVVYETYTVDQPQFGKPKNPDYLLKYNELLEMFREFRCLRYREGIIENRKAVAGIVSEKV